jgi:threonine/homoserine/homoserine lactone efflux protein
VGREELHLNTSNPKFWAGVGFVFGVILAAGGTIATPLDALIGGIIQAAIWFGVSSFFINRKNKKKQSGDSANT